MRRCRRAGALAIVNDRADVAAMAGADGVHLGATDLPVAAARSAFRPLLVGVTVRTPAGARRAARSGAWYVALGPMAPTRTKKVSARVRSAGDLRRVVEAVASCPVVAVGGITPGLAPRLFAAGAASVAVASALDVPDPAPVVRSIAAVRGR